MAKIGNLTLRGRDTYRLAVYAGFEAGKSRYLYENVRRQDGETDSAFRKRAEKQLVQFHARVSAGKVTAAGEQATVAELAALWVDTKRVARRSPKTVYDYESRLRVHVLPRIGHLKFHQVTAGHVDRLYLQLATPPRDGEDRTWLPSSMSRYTLDRTLRTFMAWAARRAKVDDPMVDVDRPQFPDIERQPPTFEDVGNVAVLLADVDPAFALYLRISNTAGQRRGQVCALRWPDIQWDQQAILFRRRLVADGGKWVELPGAKSGRGQAVAVTARTISLLREHRARFEEAARAAGVEPGVEGYVFARRNRDTGWADGSLPWRPDTATKRMKRLGKVYPALAGVTLHDLRRGMVSGMVADGFDIASVSGRAGHSSPNVTLGDYTFRVRHADVEAAAHNEARFDGLTGRRKRRAR